ncbi:hypothetical protein DFH09DRAFT_1392937 [Mycena vulgaris]|nr:hypothetical protein DFH09DRAFT_1392937 [Mycena vulgaris]
MKSVALSNAWERLKRQVSLKRPQSDLTRPQLFAPQVSLQPVAIPFFSPVPLRSVSSISVATPFTGIIFDPPPKPPPDPEHNGKRPISRLPSDIVAEIFLQVCEGSVAEYSWIACSHVCLSWRRIALDTPLLWSHIIFKSRAWVTACLERSKSSLLVVTADTWFPHVETLVCDVLKMAERIARIHLKFPLHSQRVLDLLPGPFPHLTDLSIENHSFWVPNNPVQPDVPPFPALRNLFICTNIEYLPLLPSHLVSLEIYCTGWQPVPWDSFALALGQLQQLHALKLSGFPAPPSSHTRPISLPILRDLHLSGSPKHCTQFIEALDSPKLRRFNLHFSNFDDLPALYRTLSARMPKPPKCMMIDSDDGCTAGGNNHLLWTPSATNVQTLSIAFTYANDRLPRDVALDACLSWIVPNVHIELAFATIFAALPEFAWLEHLEWLSFHHCCTIPAALWRPFLARLAGLQTLAASGSPPAGLFWALVRDLESTHVPASGGGEAETETETETGSGGCALLPAMQSIKITCVNCSAGNWLPQVRQNTSAGELPTNSYFDLDNTRFLELLICYLELRSAPLARLVMNECFEYTGAEVKLLRRLVESVRWDGVGMVEGVYRANGDDVGALTINHTLIARQKGYQELNMTDEERWREYTQFLYEVRPTTFGQKRQALPGAFYKEHIGCLVVLALIVITLDEIASPESRPSNLPREVVDISLRRGIQDRKVSSRLVEIHSAAIQNVEGGPRNLPLPTPCGSIIDQLGGRLELPRPDLVSHPSEAVENARRIRIGVGDDGKEIGSGTELVQKCRRKIVRLVADGAEDVCSYFRLDPRSLA